jgi:hypothetical protein
MLTRAKSANPKDSEYRFPQLPAPRLRVRWFTIAKGGVFAWTCTDECAPNPIPESENRPQIPLGCSIHMMDFVEPWGDEYGLHESQVQSQVRMIELSPDEEHAACY